MSSVVHLAGLIEIWFWSSSWEMKHPKSPVVQSSNKTCFKHFLIFLFCCENIYWNLHCVMTIVPLLFPTLFGRRGIFTCSPWSWVFCPLSFIHYHVLLVYYSDVCYSNGSPVFKWLSEYLNEFSLVFNTVTNAIN